MSEVARMLFKSQDEWLKARLEDVTSTQVSALPDINLNPYQTPLDLWVEKKEGKVIDFPVNERMKWGTRLQDAIGRGIAEDMKLGVRRLNGYWRKPDFRIGSSFDFEVIGHPKGPGILEVKTVDGLVFRNSWTVNDDGSVEAPAHIEFQLQHQLEVSERDWGMIVVLVGGNEPHILERDRDEKIGELIREAALRFWNSIAKGSPPAVDYARDADLIGRIYRRSTPGSVLDVTTDSLGLILTPLVQQYDLAHREVKAHEELKASTKARIIELIGPAEKVIGAGWSLSTKEVKENLGTLVTQEMVGTRFGAKAGYRGFRHYMKGEKT